MALSEDGYSTSSFGVPRNEGDSPPSDHTRCAPYPCTGTQRAVRGYP